MSMRLIEWDKFTRTIPVRESHDYDHISIPAGFPNVATALQHCQLGGPGTEKVSWHMQAPR